MKRRIAASLGALAASSFSVAAVWAIAAAASSAQPSGSTWLDGSTTNWNERGAEVPMAPPQDGNNLPYCEDSPALREATLPEDGALVDAGWTLYGSAQVFGSTTIITAMANADGMCRPLSYQAFVFKGGQFAGTLSPQVMDSRTDGSMMTYYLYGEDNITATFNRYTDQDALCCPSGQSLVSYSIKTEDGESVVVPELPASTSPNS